MAKAKETTSTTAESAEFAPEGVEKDLTVLIDHTEQIKSLEAGLADAAKEIAALGKKLQAIEKQNPNEPMKASGRCEILDRAAVIAGKMAQVSAIEGLLQGSHATTISLSAIRIASTLERVAEKVESCPELLTMRITEAHDKLEQMLREQ
jgi:hypothetical protein